ncbi:flagellar basal-body MS-ring/collar protein FliF [Pandoraea bronchicola]|uniref:Flagellar M-ring protein n=1 Tax=Pandoraea bronchicola TaxID=2508287 RepID=A0A5E5BVF3_9BURK|nr:flagellar basal-body MS-ring/collar protein FliF [Pandoraea bronchicola]VVE88290.1 flagellar MS-ring protein [Pandoraea bronchicola]
MGIDNIFRALGSAGSRSRERWLKWRAQPSSFAGQLRSALPLVVAAGAITAATLAWYSHDTGYAPLFGQNQRIPIAQATGVLEAEQIPFRMHPDTGAILVPHDRLGRARLALAAKGVTPELPPGLELVDRDERLGVRQFVQDVRFRRGLEGELARTIMSIDAVDAARVHIALAPQTSFVTHTKASASASVLISVRPGQKLAPQQVSAIVKLVAGSVNGLAAQSVSVIDQHGTPLTANLDLDDATYGNAEARMRSRDEALRNVRGLLDGILGPDRYRASVSIDLDEDLVSNTTEALGADPRVMQEAVREARDDDAVVGGVPGAMANRPVDAAPLLGGEGGAMRTTSATRQFAYDRSITQTKRHRPRVRQMHVAVMVDTQAAPGGNGWTAETIAELERTLRASAGIQIDRGDTLVVSTMPFVAADGALTFDTADTPAEGPTLTAAQKQYAAIAAAATLLIALIAWAALARRARRRKAARVAEAEARERSRREAESAAQQAALPAFANDMPPNADASFDTKLERLTTLADGEPERVAQIIKQWIGTHASAR